MLLQIPLISSALRTLRKTAMKLSLSVRVGRRALTPEMPMVRDLSTQFPVYRNRVFPERKQGSECLGTGNLSWFEALSCSPYFSFLKVIGSNPKHVVGFAPAPDD